MTPIQQLILGLNEEPLIEIMSNCKVHHAIVNDLNRLVMAAKDDDIDLTIASPFRSFKRQQLIWNNKARGVVPVKDANSNAVDSMSLSDNELLNYILHWSALPGASRHHWGTDMDIYAPSMLKAPLRLEPWEYQDGGPMAQLNTWLEENLTSYGFFRPYSKFNNGVAIEPWHISHIEQSQPLFEQLNINLIEQAIMTNDIGLKSAIIANLDTIFDQYIINVGHP